MKPYESLTEQFKKRRLRWVAEAALAEFPVEVAKLGFVAWHTNTTWKVDTTDGRRFALRVGATGADGDTDVGSELTFLEHMASAGVPVVGFHRTRDGRGWTAIEMEGVPGARKCVLFDWLPGSPLETRISVAAYRRLGELSAALHEAAHTFAPPPGFDPLVWDRVFYYPTEPVVWTDPAYDGAFPRGGRAVMEQVIARADAELARLHRGDPIPIHGDLHPDNVMSYRGALTAFDAEDVMWGFPVQDVAITLFYERERDDYPALRAAFEEGYRSMRPWPVEYEGQLELLMAARTAMFVNYVVQTDPQPAPYVDKALTRLSRFTTNWPER